MAMHPPTERSESSMTTLHGMRRRVAAALTVLAAGVLAGCAKDAPQDLFRPAGPNAREIDEGLAGQRYIFYMAGVVALIVLVAVAYIVVRYRDRGQDIPQQTHGNPKLEIALTIIPAVILATIAVPTVKKVFDLADTSDAACVVNVTGQQWWWEYDYPAQNCGGIEIPEPIVTSGEMVLPVGTPVVLRITSRDVIHSFWIPRLNGKRDAVPGRLHTLRMEADAPHLHRSVHRVLRPEPCTHAPGSGCADGHRLRHLGRQPARALHLAGSRDAGRRG